MARKTKAEAEITRQKLLDAAEILFSEKGVTNTSLCDIAEAAGVTRGAIYWHFKNKVDLFEAMHARIRLPVDEIEEQIYALPDPIGGLCDYWIKSLLELAHDDHRRRVIDILFRKCEYVNEYEAASIRIYEWGKEVITAMTLVYQKAQEQNLLAPGLKPLAVAQATYCLITGIVFNWMALPELYGDDEGVARTVTVFFNSLRA